MEVHVSVTLYTAPNCQRCTILKDFLAARGQTYAAYDFLADKEAFNAFYRAHRAELHRDEENRLEFPVYANGTVVRQGIGEILAFLLAGDGLKPCVTTTGLLHGWISGLNVSACPSGQEEHFLTLLRLLSRGGLSVALDADGRRPELLEQALGEGLVARLMLNILGPAELYPAIAGGPLPSGDLKQSLALARGCKDAVIRILVSGYADAGGAPARLTPEEAGAAAEMALLACGDRMLPVFIKAGPAGKLPPLSDAELLAYRAKARNSLVKAEICKPQTH
jgi:hypothetical protein